jgi:hypothetical protein
MAVITPNPLVETIKGKFGGMYVAKCGDKLVLKRHPTREPKPATEAQKPGRERLICANAYWRRVKTDPALRLAYTMAGKARGKRPNDLATADFMNAPTVTDIDATGYSGQPAGVIRITAEDDFEVSQVSARILDLAGTVIEEGEAALEGESQKWLYLGKTAIVAGQAVVIEITATDRPGHKGIKRIDHVCGPR